MAPPVFGAAGTLLAGERDTSAAVPVPAGVTAGQVVLVSLYLEDNRTVTGPAGFTAVGGGPIATNTQWHHVFWKRATGNDTGTYVFTWTGAASFREAVAVRITEVVPAGDPIDVFARAIINTSDAAGIPTPAVAVTTTGPDRLLVWFATIYSTGPWTPPSGFTERVDTGTEITAATRVQAAAGSSGTVTGSSAGEGRQTAVLLALTPAVTVVDHPAGVVFAGSGAMGVDARAAYRSQTAMFTGAGQMGVGGARAQTVAAQLAGAGQLTVAAVRVRPVAATFVGAGQLSATPGQAVAAGFVGAGQLLAATRQTHAATAAFTGAGSATIAARSTQRAATTLAGAGQMLATGTRAHPTAATFTGAGQMLADGRRVHPARATFVGAGGMGTVGIRSRPGTVLLAGAGRLTASARLARPGLNISLWAVTPSGLLPLPGREKLDLSRERNTVGAISVNYASGAPGFDLLRAGVTGDRDVEVEVWLGGSRDGALRGLLMQAQGDDNDPRAVWQFSGHFLEWLLSEAIIYPQPAPAEKGELVFAGRNAGEIVATVLQQAQSRGALAGMTRDWTTALDSSGQSWPQTVSSLKFSPRTTLLQVVQKLVDLDLAEFEVTAARVLRLWAPGRRGVNRSVGNDPALFRHGRVTSWPVRHSVRDSSTAVLVAGADGVYREAVSPTALARRGRRIEQGADANNLADVAAVQAFANRTMQVVGPGQTEIRHPLTFGPGDPRPGAGFDVSDTVISERAGGARLAVELQQWTLSDDRAETTGEVVLNDLIASRLQRLRRQLDAIGSGAAVIGTSTPPATDDTAAPAAPTGVTADSSAYQEGGDTVAVLYVGWAAVTTNAAGPVTPKAQAAQLILARMQSGQPMFEDWTWTGAPAVVGAWNDPLLADYEASGSTDPEGWLAGFVAANSESGTAADDIAGYRVEYAYAAEAQAWMLGADVGGQNTTSASIGSLTAGVTVRVRVKAYDRTGNVSEPSAVVELVTEVDDEAPPVPSTPIVTTRVSILAAEWDGLGSAGEPMPLDLDHVEVHVSAASNFTPVPATYYDRLGPGGGIMPITDRAYGAVTFVRLVAVDKTTPTANRSGPSQQGSATPQPVVSQDIFDGAVGSSKLALLAVKTANIDNLAVNNAKVGDLNAGKITTGVMSALLTLTGIMRTDQSPNRRMEITSNGWSAYDTTNQLWAELNLATRSMLVTGTYLSGTSGERIRLDPDGSARWYGTTGTDYASIENDNAIVRFRSRAHSSGRRSYVNFNPDGFSCHYGPSATSAISIFDLGLTYGVINAPVTGIRILRQFSPSDGTANRMHFLTAHNSGDDGNSVVHFYGRRAGGGDRGNITDDIAVFRGAARGCGILFAQGNMQVVGASDSSFGNIVANEFLPPSSLTVKSRPQPVEHVIPAGPRAVLQQAPATSWYYLDDLQPRAPKPGTWIRRVDADGTERMVEQDWLYPERPARLHFGPIAEQLAAISEHLVAREADGTVYTDLRDLIGVVWAAVADLDRDLSGRVNRLEHGHAPPVVVDGEAA